MSDRPDPSSVPYADPRLDPVDLFVFDGHAATVLVMNVRVAAGDATGDAAGAALFHPAARYEFRIHFDGSEREDLTYRVSFHSPDDGRQHYTVTRLVGDAATDDDDPGALIASGTSGEVTTTRDGGQVWTGRALDPFYLDLRQLEEVARLVRDGRQADLTRWRRGSADDSFVRSTVGSVVLTVPVGLDGLTTGRHLCVWATTRLASRPEGWRQVGRAGIPVLWTLFSPADGARSVRPEESHPADDPATYGPEVARLVASTVAQLGTSTRPDAYADSVVERILADLLRYVVGSPAVFGFARFNGRRLSDNAPEAMFSLATNAAVPTGLRGVDVGRSQEEFPYVVPAGKGT